MSEERTPWLDWSDEPWLRRLYAAVIVFATIALLFAIYTFITTGGQALVA